ncbi:MAG: hypothetical protein N4A61_16150 [Pelagimonas sp.]|jgi:anti-sigma-K factor RskA|nr:hypothetical protein [Pelagimonas sp.]
MNDTIGRRGHRGEHSGSSALAETELSQSAEYVLGLLTGPQKAEFEARLAHDTSLEQDVVAWSEYLATLTEIAPEVAPEPALLRRITAQAYGAQGPRPPIWRQVLPYLIGGALGGLLVWLAVWAGWVQTY